MSENTITSPKVFISYSWAVQEKAVELADRLLANGVDAIIDVYDLKEGQDKYAFMEQSVNDPTVNHVLIICDKTYAEKANNRKGGVGDETVIITPQVYGDVEQTKFIPIIVEKDENQNTYCPNYIKSRIYIDLSDEDIYESEYEKLLRALYHKPLYQKPALGRRPEWLESETVDLSAIRDVIKQIKSLKDINTPKADFLFKRATDDFINAARQYKITGTKDLNVEFLEIIDQSKTYRNLFMDYCEAIICSNLPFADVIVPFFEQLYNGLHDATERNSCRDQDFEFADFIIWEFFIDMTALLLYFEKYQELHDVLTRQYYLRTNPLCGSFDFRSYCRFKMYSSIIEGVCKQQSSNPRLFTLAGDIIINREKRPILTKKTICDADIILSQLAPILAQSNGNSLHCFWFPATYVYNDPVSVQPIWHKLKSQKHCSKIASLLGVNSISEIKSVLQQAPDNCDMRYSGALEHAPGIRESINVKDIGTLP